MRRRHIELPETLAGTRAIIFDVGETLVDETRMWTGWVKQAGVSSLTMFAMLGSLIERGEDHRIMWAEPGVRSPESALWIVKSDIYPDALACLETVKASGRLVGIAGNQPEGLEAQLRSLGFNADFITSSRERGVSKPAEAFFRRVVASTGMAASEILYGRDRLDNDIVPAKAVGMRTTDGGHGPTSRSDGRKLNLPI